MEIANIFVMLDGDDFTELLTVDDFLDLCKKFVYLSTWQTITLRPFSSAFS